MNVFRQRAMLAHCAVTRWNPRVLDRKVTADIQNSHAATTDSGDFRKALVDKSAVKDLNASAGAIRALHYKLTLPWDDEGARLLPTRSFQKYTDEMRALNQADERLRDAFIAMYPTLVLNAKARLGTMYDPEDYPSADEVLGKFSVKLTFTPVPDAADFRLEVSDEIADELRTQLVSEQDAKFQNAMRDCYKRVESVVTTLSKTLRKEEPRIFASLVGNARELVECMTNLNVANDADLEAVRASLDAMLPASSDALKNNPDLRKRVADDADELLAKLAGRTK